MERSEAEIKSDSRKSCPEGGQNGWDTEQKVQRSGGTN